MEGGWWGVEGHLGCPTFLFFKSLDNNMVYSLGVYVYVYICIQEKLLQAKSLLGFKIW